MDLEGSRDEMSDRSKNGKGVSSPSDSRDNSASDLVAAAGHFRIYLGSAAGVGKTCAMLDEGNRRLARGSDVIVGYVESHARPYTLQAIGSLEILPRRRVIYRNVAFEELDVTEVIKRKPQVALIDELAHTNVPSTWHNAKRWQDVMEILEAGIDVVTTVNIQHLESIADAVEAITGVKVQERVPDAMVRKADQIELVDSSPEQLRRRMLHGNIYPQPKIANALANFFRTDNLLALRELSLRFVADESEEDLLDYLRARKIDKVWETTERILVGVTAAPRTDMLLRRAARIAGRTRGQLKVLHVYTGDVDKGKSSEKIQALKALALDLGATWDEIVSEGPAEAIITFAIEHQITQIVIGSSPSGRFRSLLSGNSVNRQIMQSASKHGIDLIVIARRDDIGLTHSSD
ncbi:MAG: universal stress protein [Acidimicrobiales bacterium]|nr:universal stress protein [Acidimicrobiales bacterium]